MRFLCRQRILKVMVISLVIVLEFGVLLGTAQGEDSYPLAELIMGGSIPVGSLTFSNFSLLNLGTTPGVTPANAAGLFVEVLGVDSPQPGLRINANNQLSVEGLGLLVQATLLSYDVTDANGSIQGMSLLLVPSCSASGNSSGVEVMIENVPADPPLISVFRSVSPFTGVEELLLAEVDFSALQKDLSVTSRILINAQSKSSLELGQASLCAIEYRFKLASTRADAGPDQVVQDSVMLDGSGSEGNGLTYAWRLIPRDPSLPEITPEPIMNPRVEGLAKSLYDVTLTVTDENGLVDTDTMLLAAAGACEEDGQLPPVNGKLKLWKFEIKKYKFCKWASARVNGTVEASDLPLASSNDEEGLKAKVILQVVDKDGNTVGEYSDETAVEIKDRRYKYVIGKKH